MAVYQHLENNGHDNFTIGITDDVTNLSLEVDETIDVSDKDTTEALFLV